MGLDRFLELEVAGGIRQREAVIRHGQVQASRLAEPPLPMRRPDRVHRRAGGEVERSLVALDVGIDLVAAGGDRQRQPLVAVLDEVGVVDQGDRQVDHPWVRGALLDLPPEASRSRAEAPVEVVDAVNGADDVRDRPSRRPTGRRVPRRRRRWTSSNTRRSTQSRPRNGRFATRSDARPTEMRRPAAEPSAGSTRSERCR